MRRQSKHITQAQIARAAGVSQATVSAVLSGSQLMNVGEETRAAILALVEKHGYIDRRPVKRARVAAAGRPSVLLVEKAGTPRLTNEVWVEEAIQSVMGKIFSASSRELQKHGFGLSVFYLEEAQDLTHWLADSNICGVLWHAGESDSALLHWVSSRYPLVLLNQDWKTATAVDTAGIDQEKLFLLAAEHLWEMGHRRIAFFGHNGSSICHRRLEAYRRFVSERGLRNYSEFQEISDALEGPAMTKVAEIIATWKRLGNDAPTALVASDAFILPLTREARREGIRIPEELSVIGTNNTTTCSLVEPALTAINEPFEEMCRVAVELLLRRRERPEEPFRSVQIAPRLIQRDSVARLISGQRPTPVHSMA